MVSQETNLALMLQKIKDLEDNREKDLQEIEDLKSWKDACTRWGAWWAGVCATVMTIAALVRTYWDVIVDFVQRNH